ncbi:MAG: TIM barrel protein [Opitutaceae bacterium]|nr:TIM barrel protein [Opitutaceae bacterium]
MTELELLDYARAQGLRLVQIGDHVPLHEFDAARLERLRLNASSIDHPVTLEIGARGLAEAHLKHYVDLAAKLDCRLVRFVVDRGTYEPSIDEVAALVRVALPELEAANVTLGIENHDRFPARTLRRLVERVGSDRVGICLDTANSLGAGEGLEYVLDQLIEHTVNLHVKDFAIIRVSYAMGFVVEGRPAGEGILDVREICARLRKCGRCRTAVLETWTPPESDIEATIAKERKWANQSLAFLKPLFTP